MSIFPSFFSFSFPLNAEQDSKSGFTKILNPEPIMIQIHNPDQITLSKLAFFVFFSFFLADFWSETVSGSLDNFVEKDETFL
jgi:hypothetical protein